MHLMQHMSKLKTRLCVLFLSDANPFLFSDRGSADPAVLDEFEKDFDENFSTSPSLSESLAFVRAYLSRQDNPVLLNEFNSKIDEATWEHLLN